MVEIGDVTNLGKEKARRFEAMNHRAGNLDARWRRPDRLRSRSQARLNGATNAE